MRATQQGEQAGCMGERVCGGHSWNSSQTREAAWLDDDGDEEFCSQILLAVPDAVAE